MKIALAGTGSKLPSKVLTNDDLSKIVDTSDEWISQRTGIKKRHIIGENENLVSLAFAAGKEALESATHMRYLGVSYPEWKYPL